MYSESIKIERGGILLKNKQTGDFEVAVARGYQTPYTLEPLKPGHPFVQLLEAKQKAIQLNDVQEFEEFAEHRGLLLEMMNDLGVVLVIPVLYEHRLIGITGLGEKMSGEWYSSEDIDLLQTLMNHTAVSIENALKVAELKKMIELEASYRELKKLDEMKDNFLSMVSHDLRTPMTSIKGYTKLLQMGGGSMLSPEQQQDFLQIIINSVDRMAGLVNDLLDVSRIEAGRIRLEISDVQMSDVINEVIEAVQTQIDKKQQQLILDVPDDLPQLRADYNRMVQIVTNLVSNAFKYTPEGGEITVIAKPYQNEAVHGVMVTVKDTGYGISEEDQAQLFTNFFRSADQNIRDEPGTGLGLSITKNMIETHGGELTLESKLGEGSAFTFTMPQVCKVPPGVEVVER